ncbi:MAG: class I tRNA ligase family protein, partial [Alphaproteobacteria bacterium]|nr:class I tRNA ligase family protein [Alphaproteobacteria bacterium]
PESGDSEFTWENFQQSVNKDLADVLGNFVSRITKFCRSKFGEMVPEGPAYGAEELSLIENLTARVRVYEGNMAAMEVRKAATELRAIWVLGNEYLQAAAPWTVFKTDPDKAAMQVRMGLNLMRLYAILSAPFIPFASRAMLEALGGTEAGWPDDVAQALSALPAGHAFTVPEVMFAKISDENRAEWEERFKGTRA